MNKKFIIGIIIAVAIVGGIGSVISYNVTQNTTDRLGTGTQDANTTEGQHITIGLSDGVGISSNP